MSAAPTLAEIKQLLQVQALPLAMQLAPAHGKRSGKWWVACNPTRDDKTPSFGIAVTGGAPGAWKDFATGDKGDVLQLIQYCQGLPDLGAVLAWARAWLGLDGAAPPAIQRRIVEARENADVRLAEQDARAADNAVRAAKAYKASKMRPFVGSPAAIYLLGRGIDVTRLARVPGALGFLTDCWHAESERKFVCMVAGFNDVAGATVAIHRTFLAREPSGRWVKAPVAPVRKIWPSYKGAAIRLARGSSGLSIEAAAKQGLRETLVLVEGVEDGLSVALSAPDYRVWAAGSLGNLSEIVLPECVDDVIVCADNDWGKPQAQAMLNKALDCLARQGRRVRVARSSVGKDVNDALVG